MYNKTILMGRICNDLELKTTQSGNSVLSFRLAVERSYQAQGEERKTDFFNIVAWRNTAEFISKYFKKGLMIIVDGELQTRQYQDKDGKNVTVTELVVSSAGFTGEKKEQSSSAPTAVPPATQNNSSGDNAESETNDDYPF